MSNDEHREQLRDMVGEILPPELRDQIADYARMDAFLGDDGEIDREKVMGHLTAIHVATQRPAPPEDTARQSNWGQHSGQPIADTVGAQGRAALEKRHGVKNASPVPSSTAMARAAMMQRHPGRTSRLT